MITHELVDIAQGRTRNDAALMKALECPSLDDEEVKVLYRWIDGLNTEPDVAALEAIAIKVRESER